MAKTTELSELAQGIARVFGTPPITTAQVANVDGLSQMLEEAGARVVLWSRYGDRITLANDERILAENTDAAFWDSRSLLIAPSISFEGAGAFADKCFPVDGPTTATALLAWYRANVRRVLFDVDTIILAESARRVLIAAHYGSVVLFEPSPGRQ